MNYAVWGFDELGKELGSFLNQILTYDNMVCYVDGELVNLDKTLSIPVVSPLDLSVLVKCGIVEKILVPGYDPGKYRTILQKMYRVGLKNTDGIILYAEIDWYKKTTNYANRLEELVRESYKQIPLIGALEYEVVENCNLNCKRCNHFSNIFYSGKQIDINSFAKDLNDISDLVYKIKRFKILGGEPLLNHDLHKYICIAREKLKNAYIAVVTNGLLVKQTNDLVWSACKDNDIVIEISIYPPFKAAVEEAIEYLEDKGVKTKVFRIGNQFGAFINMKGDSDDYWAMMQCYAQVCHSIKDGKIYKCSSVVNIDVFNNAYDVAIPQNYLTIYDLKKEPLPGRILARYLNDPIGMCKYCTKFEFHPWERSYNEVDFHDWTVE